MQVTTCKQGSKESRNYVEAQNLIIYLQSSLQTRNTRKNL